MRERGVAILADSMEEYLKEEKITSLQLETDLLFSHINKLTISTTTLIDSDDLLTDELGFNRKYHIKKKYEIHYKLIKIKRNKTKPRGKISKKF